MKKQIKSLLLFSLLALFTTDCGTNLFQAPDSLLETSAEGLVMLGNRAKRAGDYDKAFGYYTRATEKDPELSDGWYLQAEMILLTAKPKAIRLPDLIDELINENSSKLPFFPDANTPNVTLRNVQIPKRSNPNEDTIIAFTLYDSLYNRLADLYNPTMRAYASLERIYGDGTSEYKTANKGTFTKDIVRMDFTMLSALRTALISLDQKPKDGMLDISLGPWNAERKLYMIMAGGLKDINNININVDSVKQLFDGPSDINGMIENLIAAAEISLNAITDTKMELEGANIDSAKKAMMNDPQKQMQTIIAKAGYFYYNDWKDNDNDFFKTPGSHPDFPQRMIWFDTNGNKHIDWIDPTDNSREINLTTTISDIRRNHGRIPVNYVREGYNSTTGEYDSTLFLVKIVDTDTFYSFKGAHGGEFVAGDWGIDEERMDDADSDGDGLKDEDSRVVRDSLDQDGDFIKIDNRLQYQTGKFAFDSTIMDFRPTAPMIWHDTITTDGRITGPGGVIINRAHVVANKDAIIAAINSGAGYGEWIAGDWGIDEEYYDGIDNDGDGLIDEDGDIDMRTIHLWSPMYKQAFINYIKQHIANNPESIRARE